MGEPTEPLDVWFKREVLCHEAVLMSFLSRVWVHRDEREDIRQETYARVYEAARKMRPKIPKAFLFSTARNLMTDRIRRERVVSIKAGGENEWSNVLIDEISSEQRASADEELRRLARAFDRLPPKCREVVWLRRVKGLSQKEAAAKLGISDKTIQKHLTTGLRQLTEYMGANMLVPRRACFDETEDGQGQREQED
jgi:RNA polymerase sigma-70 factor (ECF subfamily)